ncbi:ABC transporter ATP-binding protein [Haliangium sp.]|uniref:ABC transporter ATP-binding protein n=1 Tax=Haliangium sp. TaxID=2663208 RepID=UPI003D12702D
MDDLVIKLRDVRKSYGTGAGRTPVLRGVSFDVRRGELIALVGQSGSGKSTLLNIIGGLDRADEGQVEVLGQDYANTSEARLAALRNRDIGFVFQSFNLLDHLSCLGNVTLPAVFSRAAGQEEHARGMEALRRVGMSDLAHRKPGELSGGQKQRVAIARALFCRPSLLLCDEPTGNLDSHTGREVIDFFRELNERDRVTLVIVTHERRVSKVAARVISMRDGLVVEGADAGAPINGDGDAGGGDDDDSGAHELNGGPA